MKFEIRLIKDKDGNKCDQYYTGDYFSPNEAYGLVGHWNDDIVYKMNDKRQWKVEYSYR
jgi:hypothetical protein